MTDEYGTEQDRLRDIMRLADELREHDEHLAALESASSPASLASIMAQRRRVRGAVAALTRAATASSKLRRLASEHQREADSFKATLGERTR